MTRARKITTAVVIAFFVLLLSSSGIARLYTDYLWFDALNSSQVWTTLIGTKLWLALTFSVVFSAMLWGNLYLAGRLAPEVRPLTPEDDLLERYHSLVGNNGGRVRIAISVLFGLLLGLSTAGQWNPWILFRNGSDFGVVDPVFGKDASFYVFRLPFWNFLVNWTFTAIIFTIVFTVAAHYLNGGIRASNMTNRVSEGAKIHLSVLIALLALVRAVMYHLDRFDLLTQTGGVVDGALATDLTVRLPALNLLTAISVFVAALFVANIWRHGWTLPAVAVGLWLVVSISAGAIFPAVYQRIRVQPERTTREAEYVSRNIDATLFAYGLDSSRLTVENYEYVDDFTTDTLTENEDIFGSVALLDPVLAQEQFSKTQSGKPFYGFSDVLDVDRYKKDGVTTPLLISSRDLIPSVLEDEWEIQHIVYTHGYGVVAATANDIGRGGAPEFVVSDLGPALTTAEDIEIELTQPQVYFGESFDGYAIVGATRDEIDYESATQGTSRYDGEGGIKIGSFMRKAAFALRFGDLNIALSNFLTEDSQMIFKRDVMERVSELAPYLGLDQDPYPVVHDGRVKFIVDAYTTTSRFPYSDIQGDPISGEFNYIRNSVKAVVDAYDGDVTFYVVDDSDPIAAAYAKAFPELYSEADDIPADLADNFRYPQFLFDVQSSVYATYQVSDPVSLIQKGQSWSISTQPQTESDTSTVPSSDPMEPQYMVTRLPGGDELEFVLQRSFVPAIQGGNADNARPELTAVMYARSDPGHYGELLVYRLQSDNVIAAPDLVDSNIRKDSTISQYITPLDLQGSTVQFGNMVTVLVDGRIVYVRPLYVEAQGGPGVPVLDTVIAVSGSKIAMAETLEEALLAVATGVEPVLVPPTDDPGDTPVETPDTSADLEGLSISELLGRASDALNAAETIDATEGDAEEAARLRADAAAAIIRVEELLGIDTGSNSDQDSGDA